jgi:hypothetical protein
MLILGTDKTSTFLEQLPESYLLIDDGTLIDQLEFPHKRPAKSTLPLITRLDLSKHSLNPLTDINDTQEGVLKARQFLEILAADGVFPQGATTLTRKNSDDLLLHALVQNKSRTLSQLIPTPDPKDAAAVDAYQKISNILLSPVLRRVLDRPTHLSSKGIIIARLDPAELGDFDCILLGNFLIAAYKGPIAVTDFGLYAIPSHIRLARQGRLIAGLDFLSDLDRREGQLDKLRSQLLSEGATNLFHYKRTAAYTHYARHTSYDDAVTLARYAGLRPDYLREDNPYNTFIQECMA